MVKNITKIGNSQGIILDAALMELTHLKVGDTVNVEVHQGGTITLTPVRKQVAADEARLLARQIISENSELFRRLS